MAGQTAIVTGAGSGIGRATARYSPRGGARVVGTGPQPQPLRETVAIHDRLRAIPEWPGCSGAFLK